MNAPSPASAAEAKAPPTAQKPPVAQKPPKARAKVAPRQSTAHLTHIEASTPRKPAVKQAGTASKQVKAAPQATTDDKLKNSLDTFAQSCIESMNKQRLPSITHKEVKKQPDGTYLARYMAYDIDSLETSYNPTENNKTIKYIGRMNYHEVEYVSTGKDQKQALAGPFSESNRTPIIELIKYKAGKWTY
ncbi:MAG: hypothetical protein LIP28_06485 [Deltaproteobacteria bacterium]|nr:hypothetical protein [Deltaproteobacteria bacterium]